MLSGIEYRYEAGASHRAPSPEVPRERWVGHAKTATRGAACAAVSSKLSSTRTASQCRKALMTRVISVLGTRAYRPPKAHTCGPSTRARYPLPPPQADGAEWMQVPSAPACAYVCLPC